MFTENNSKIAELAEEAKAVESDSAKFMDPGAKRKNKPGAGRPKGGSKKSSESPLQQAPQSGPQEFSPPPIPTKDVVKPMLQILSTWAGRAVGDKRAEMLPEELDAIATSGAMIVDKWMPVLAGQYAVELMFCATLGTYMLRIYAIKQVRDEDRKAAERHQFANGAAGPGTPTPSRQEVRDYNPSRNPTTGPGQTLVI